MDYYRIKSPGSNYNLHQINHKINKDLDNPIGYCSYSDNDISDKLSNNNSDYEEYRKPYENTNSLKEKQSIKNSLIPTRHHMKFSKEKNIFKNNATNFYPKNTNKFHNLNNNNNNKILNQNNFNNNFYVAINENNNNNYENQINYKSNDTYLNHYINRKNYSNNKNYKKFEKIKNNKKRKDNIQQDNKLDNKDIKNKNKGNHFKFKSLKYIMDNSSDIINEKEEHNKNNNTNNNKVFFNKYIGEQNKNINYNYFILNSKNLSNNPKICQERKTSINKDSIQNKSFNQNYYFNKYKNYNSSKPTKNKNDENYICLRNSNNNYRKNPEYENYFSISNECLELTTLNPRYSCSHNIFDEINNEKSINPSKYSYQNINKKFSKTFFDMRDIKLNESKQNENQKKDKNLKLKNEENFELFKKSSNSVQKSYKKKLLNLNTNNIRKNKIYELKKKNLIIKTNFDKNNPELLFTNIANPSSTSKSKAISPIASQINNNLVNTEKISKNKYDYLINKIDFKKKISFNGSNNNTITNSKTITNQNSHMILPTGNINKNKNININIDLSEKNDINKNNTRIMIYKKRRISNNKYQAKIKKENSKNENIENLTLLLKTYLTENKKTKEGNNICQEKIKNMKKVALFKPLSIEKKIQNNNNNKIEDKIKIDSISDNMRGNNYLRKNVNIKNENKSKIYMKGILKKWNINAKKISVPKKEINPKIINKFSFTNKFYFFGIKKNQIKISFITKRYKLKMPINDLCIYSKNIKKKKEEENIIVINGEKNLINDSKDIKQKDLENNSNLSIIKKSNNSNSKNSNDKNNKEDMENNASTSNKNAELFEEMEDNENEDFKIEEYEEKHINSIMNINKNNNSINNSNSLLNLNNIIAETLGKEIPTNSEACSLMNSKMSLNSNPKNKEFRKIEVGLEKLCRLFFKKVKDSNAQENIKNELKIIKKEKSDSNINSKNISKISSIFSSTIQNWNDIDRKYYEKEDIPFDFNNILNRGNKKYRKNKKHAKLLNINKAFSEEKIREQGDILRRSAKLNSKVKLEKNNKSKEKSNKKNDNKEFIEDNNINNNIINNQKEKYTELLNILTIKNYANIFLKLLNLINNQNEIVNNKNSYEILLNNQFIFTEVLVEKAIKEKAYMSLYAKIGKDLYLKLISNYININKKKVKGENLKSIISTECRQKFDECDIITLLNLEKNKLNDKENIFENLKIKLIGIINFICELINNKMISQKMGLEYLDILHKRIINYEEDIQNYDDKEYLIKYKYLYIEAELILLEQLSKIIIERKKPKHIQDLKNFIEDNIIPKAENNKNSEEQLSNYLICKIVNLLDKLRKTKQFNSIKQIKIEDKKNQINKNKNDKKETNINTNNIEKVNIDDINKDNNLNTNNIEEGNNDNNNKDNNLYINNIGKNNMDNNNQIELKDNKSSEEENSKNNNNIDIKEDDEKALKIDEDSDNIKSLKKEIEDYMIFLSEHEKDQYQNSEYDINDEFNWNIVDNLFVNKKLPLEKIIIYYIKICIDIINDKNKILKANEYIKNVINYYSYNLTNENVNNMHSKMIELFLDIDKICINNNYMYEIMGYLLFLLLTNNYKLFYIKDLNNFLNKDINTQINIAKVVKNTIIYFEYNWKKYFNVFKKINLFKNGNVFNNYITSPLKLKGLSI